LSHRANHGVTNISPASKPLLTSSQPDLDSKEDQNSVGQCPVPDSVIEEMKGLVKKWTDEGGLGHGILTSSPHPLRLCIFDGFLLYSQSMISVQPQIDIKMFLRVSYAKAKARREARSGYVTLEGFWEDPPGYVDKIVWPNYVEDHKFMFENEDVEGELKEEVVKQWGINYLKEGLDVDMAAMLRWAVDILMERLPMLAKASV
jgi:nicotinamide/nicotinate riboside kinase